MHISIAFNLGGTEAQGTEMTKWKGKCGEMFCKHGIQRDAIYHGKLSEACGKAIFSGQVVFLICFHFWQEKAMLFCISLGSTILGGRTIYLGWIGNI